MNHKDVQNVEELENKKETTIEDSEDNRIMKKMAVELLQQPFILKCK